MSRDLEKRIQEIRKSKRTPREKKLLLRCIVINPVSYLMVLTFPTVIWMGITGLKTEIFALLYGMIILAFGMVALLTITHLLVFLPYVEKKERERKERERKENEWKRKPANWGKEYNP